MSVSDAVVTALDPVLAVDVAVMLPLPPFKNCDSAEDSSTVSDDAEEMLDKVVDGICRTSEAEPESPRNV